MLLFLLEKGLTFLLIFTAALIHELGHLFCIRLCKARIIRTDIEAVGALIVYSSGETSLDEDIAIALGGIIFNFITAILGILFFTYYYNLYLLIFILANMALACINLLPVSFLDGGRFLHSFLLKKVTVDKAERISHITSVTSKILLLIFTAFLIYISGFNTALIILFLINLLQIFD